MLDLDFHADGCIPSPLPFLSLSRIRSDPILILSYPILSYPILSYPVLSYSYSRCTSWATLWQTPRSSPSSADTPRRPRRGGASALTRPRSRWPG